jgi:CRP/FNR family transcriptional regulator, cyclic AMP receptor protein
MAAIDVLRESPLLRGFSPTGLQILAGISHERRFPGGVPLFVENMISDSMLIIGEGRVRLSAKSAGGEEVSLGELQPGDSLGELALVSMGQRLCTATAATPVYAVEIRHQDFQKLMLQKPQACLKLLMGIVGAFGHKVQDNRDAFRALLSRK